MGICLARTDPDAPKHRGITYFLVDMRAPGITVRPLREITGAALFNEVFFDGCFVPDECVVGEVNGGWRLARTTLANERVSLSSDSAFGGVLEEVLALFASRPELGDPVTLDRLGALIAEAQSLAQLGLRATIRSVSRLEPGPESSVGKLAGAEFDQRVHEFGLDLLGPEGVRCRRRGRELGARRPSEQVPDHRGGYQRGPAQRDRGAAARASAGSRARPVRQRSCTPGCARIGGAEHEDGGPIDG